MPEPKQPPDPNVTPPPEGLKLPKTWSTHQMMSMSYQLEILWYQNGFAHSAGMTMSSDCKTLSANALLVHPSRAFSYPPLGATLKSSCTLHLT
ncbi:hypothetical protein BJV78DRAFT_457387 [Lactifluus subvellereus]|nr:hypothetical protein BJV78DRAFT_457387 [Lactifluus subvellereus]